MSTPSGNRMSPLERHARQLLRVYPAAYRSERGEEIIGTLLEATPEGVAWPLPRDIRGLTSGGLRARAMQNRQRTTTANVRLAALVGVAAYLAQLATAVLKIFVRYQLASGWQSQYSPYGWPLAAGMVVMLLTVATVWLSSRRAAVVLGALSAATAVTYAGPWRSGADTTGIAYLLSLAAMIMLANSRSRPGLRWLWLVGLAVAVPLVPWPVLSGGVLLAAGIASIAWVAVDARPFLALVVYFLAGALPVAISNVVSGVGIVGPVVLLGVAAAVTAPALWLLWRQSARSGRPTQT